MVHFTCDMCGKSLLVDENIRYEIRIEIKAAYDPMEIAEENLERDYTEDIEELIEKMEDFEESELQDEVYKVIKLDLCVQCHKQYINDPLFKKHARRFKHLDN